MHRFISLLLFFVTMSLAVSCAKGPAEKTGGPYAEAMKAVETYRFDAADSLLAGLAKSDSAGYYTTYGQGVSYEHQLLFSDALNSYLLTVSHYSDSGAALAGLSRMFTVLEAPDEAVEAARRWSQAEKGNNEARMRLIRAQIDAGMYQKAEQSLDDARKVGLDKGVAGLLEARLQVVSRMYDEAARVATQARNEGSETPDFLLALADYYAERGLVDSAVQAGNKSYEISHDLFYGYINFQRCLKHQYFAAARAFINDLAQEDKSKIPTIAATIEYKIAAIERAQLSRLADQLERLRPEKYTTLFLALAARQSIGDLAMGHQHVEALRALLALPGVYPPLKAFLSWQILSSKYSRWPYGPRDIMGELDSLKGWREGLPRYQALAAGSLLADTSRAPFNKRVDSLMKANAGNPSWLARLGLVFSEEVGVGRGNWIRVLAFVLQKDPQSIVARCGLIDNAIADARFSDVITLANGDPAFVDLCPEYGLKKAYAEAMLGQNAEALASFEKSYPLVAGEITEVEAIASKLLQLGKRSDAERVVARCLELSPKDGDACLLASDFQYKLGNYQQSLDAAEKGIQAEPEYVRLPSYKARAMYALGQKEEAKKILSDILAKAPTDPDASLVLSRILADENGDPNRAQNLARQAQVFGNLSTHPTLNLAYVYIKGGRYDLGLGAAQQALTTYPDDPEAYYYVGICSYYAKRPGAKENLQKAIALGLTGELLQSARETLSKI